MKTLEFRNNGWWLIMAIVTILLFQTGNIVCAQKKEAETLVCWCGFATIQVKDEFIRQSYALSENKWFVIDIPEGGTIALFSTSTSSRENDRGDDLCLVSTLDVFDGIGLLYWKRTYMQTEFIAIIKEGRITKIGPLIKRLAGTKNSVLLVQLVEMRSNGLIRLVVRTYSPGSIFPKPYRAD